MARIETQSLCQLSFLDYVSVCFLRIVIRCVRDNRSRFLFFFVAFSSSFWTTTDASILLQCRWRPRMPLKHSREKSTDSVFHLFQSLMNHRPQQCCPPPTMILHRPFWKRPNPTQKKCSPRMELLLTMRVEEKTMIINPVELVSLEELENSRAIFQK